MSSDTLTTRALRHELQLLDRERVMACALIKTTRRDRRLMIERAGGAFSRTRRLLEQNTRTDALFRGKLQELAGQMDALSAAGEQYGLELLQSQGQTAGVSLRHALSSKHLSGDDLLPIACEIEAACTTVSIISEMVGLPLPECAVAEEREPVGQESQNPLQLALEKCAAETASEFDKAVQLECEGLELIPADWQSSCFDIMVQLIRNAVEHGIESAERRLSADKPANGKVTVCFAIEHGVPQLSVADDGAGLDGVRIAALAIERGLLHERKHGPDPRQVARMIFLPGLSTGAHPEGRGRGMKIVRDQLRRLGGKIKVATRSGLFTRIEMTLPVIDGSAGATA